MNEDKQWPEDQADWPHAVGVVQGGVDHRLKSVFCICSSDGKSAYIDVFSNGKLVLRGDLPTDEAAEIFMKEMGESIQDLQDRQVLQKQRDELLKQRNALMTAAKTLQQHGFFEQSSCASDEQNAAMQTMREAIAQVEGGAV